MRSSVFAKCLRRGSALLLTLLAIGVHGQSITDVRSNLESGKYEDAIRDGRELMKDNRSEDLALLVAQAFVETGRMDEAIGVVTNALRRNSMSIQLRLVGHNAAKHAGQVEQADEFLSEINQLGGVRRWLYGEPENRVALGRAALLLGAEPRIVLENYFDVAKRMEPNLKSVYLAAGALALDKGDDALASRTFSEGLGKFPKDPDLLAGLAKSFAESDRQEMVKAIEGALERNPKHPGVLLLLTDHLIDAEQYTEAEETIQKVLDVNPRRPEAWAFRAVIAHMHNKPEEEIQARGRALERWTNNPSVDHLIGRQLSQKYRFKEGAEYQRKALAADPEHVSAKVQLAQDLLRLGEDEEGWKMAHDAHEADGYDTIAYNLVTLHDSISKFVLLTNQHFRVRMSAKEAAVYGDRVMDLLGRARTLMTAKYGAKIADPTVVEIFPEQKDFAIRTFSMPGGVGYLGVCFGTVITANSPAAHKGAEINWESMLWHEFCHVITLQMTRNKMPRWLSEGISVYEEHQANPAWGEQLTPEYRDMILEGEMKKVSDLSSAFMSPKSGTHLQFAYYQSYMVVDFLVQRFGIESIRKILGDLGDGVEINKAIEKHTTSMETLEKDFAAFAEEHAKALAPDLDFSKPGRGADWSELVPNNYYALMRKAAELLEEEKYEEAIEPLKTILTAHPRQTGPDSAHAMLASVYRKLGRNEEERRTLLRWAEVDAEALGAFERLMDYAIEEKDWTAVVRHAQRFLAVNPLLIKPYAALAKAHEASEKPAEAVRAIEIALALEPVDPVTLHYDAARLLSGSSPDRARKHVVQALEEAPRFRKAHALLLELTNATNPARKPPVGEEPAAEPASTPPPSL